MPRPKLEPTHKQREFVRTLTGYGFSQEMIARRIGIRSPKTLRKHFREELDKGSLDANATVAQTAFQMAISGKHPLMTMFWMKCRGGWRESRDAQVMPSALPPFIVAKEGAL
jgi:hypothetical protein